MTHYNGKLMHVVYTGKMMKPFVGKHTKKLYGVLIPGIRYHIHPMDIASDLVEITPPQYRTGELFSQIAGQFKPKGKSCKCNKIRHKMDVYGPYNGLFNCLIFSKMVAESSGWNIWWRYPIAIVIMYICIYEILLLGVNKGYEDIKILSGMG